MPRMPPFGKATRRGRDERLLRSFEKEGQVQIARALNKLRIDLFRGITEDNVQLIVQRLHDPEIVRPFQDTVERLMREWALAGVTNGRRQIEDEVLGVRR